jgi:hypothetical protein
MNPNRESSGEDPAATVYCGACGAELSGTAKFCRACGSPQEQFSESETEVPITAVTKVKAPIAPPPAAAAPQPPPPLPPAAAVPVAAPAPRTHSGGGFDAVASLLAIAGGLGMAVVFIYTIVYYPLHNGYSVNFGESIKFGDLLAIVSAVAAITIGVLAVQRPPANARATGVALIAAGVPTLALTLLWGLPETFHLTTYPQPFYFGFVYFSDLGHTYVDNGYLQVTLAASSAAVALAGLLIAASPAAGRQRHGPR